MVLALPVEEEPTGEAEFKPVRETGEVEEGGTIECTDCCPWPLDNCR